MSRGPQDPRLETAEPSRTFSVADLGALFDGAPFGVLALCAEGVMSYVNPRQCEYSQLPPEAFLGKLQRAVFGAMLERSGLLDLCDQLIERGSAFEKTVLDYTRLADGVPVAITLRGYRLGPWNVLITTVERTLAERQARYTQLFENANDGIFILSREGKYLEVNRRYCEIVGIPAERLIGQTTEVILPGRLAESLARVERVIHEGRLGPYEVEIVTPNGIKHVALNAFALVENGERIGMIAIVRDVSDERRQRDERAKLYQALWESEEKFRRIVEGNPHPVALSDLKDGHFLEVNDAWCQLSGLSRDDFLRPETRVWDVWPDREERRKFRDALLRDGVARDFEAHLEVRGEPRIGSFSGTLVDFDGRPTVVTWVRDVTREHERERALRESEEKFRTMIEMTPDSVVLTDLESGEYLQVNQAWCEATGICREDAIGRTTSALGLWVSTEEARRYLLYLKRGSRQPTDIRFRRADGTIRIASMTGMILRFGERQVAMITARDITERRKAEQALRESEERFRSLAEVAPIGIYRTDPTGRNVYANPRWQQIAGLSAAETLGEGWAKAFHPEDRERARKHWDEAVRAGADFDGEYRLLTPQGEVRWIHGTGAPVRSASGEILGFVGTTQDITERKRNEELIRDSQKAIEQTRADFVAMVTHDLKNPLVAIAGLASLVSEVPPAEREGLLTGIESASMRALAIANNFLDYTRIQSGALELERRPAQLNEIVLEMVDAQRSVASARGVGFETELDDELPRLLLDEPLFGRVVTNLVSNAIKFSPDGGRVWVRCRGGEGGVELSVRDEGPGIPPAERTKLFRRFGLLSQRRKDSTGLGLFIVKTVVESHGGTVEVDCPPEGGSVFRVRLPQTLAAIGEETEGRAAGEAPARATPGPTESEGLGESQVLVVEDDHMTRRYMEMLLRAHCRVSLAASAADAVALLSTQPIDLVLMDVSLRGGEDGLTLTRKLRQDARWRGLPIMALTAHSLPEDRQRALDAGCNDYLTKPFEARDLLAKMATLLGLSGKPNGEPLASTK